MNPHLYRHAPRGWREKVAPAATFIFTPTRPKSCSLVRTNKATQAKRKNRITLAPVSITAKDQS